MLRLRLRLGAGSRSRRSPVGPFVAGSCAAHVLAIAAVLMMPSLRGRAEIPDHFMVDIVPVPAGSGAPEATAPAAVPPPPPEPEPSRPAEGVHVETREPVEVDRPKPPPAEKPRPAPENRPPPAASPTTQPAPGEAGTGAGGAEAGASVEAMQGGDAAFAWYRASAAAAVYRRWRRPLLSGLSEPVDVTVNFDILRDGRVSGLQILESSGIPSLDRSALRAVGDASPLPPLPASWREPLLPATFRFRLYPEGL